MSKKFICLVGPDGAGKTTVAKLLLPRLTEEYGLFKTRHIGDYLPHNKLSFKPPSYVYSTEKQSKKQTRTKQTKRNVYHFFASLVLSAEFLFFFLFKERVFDRKTHLLMDHCPYDNLVENNRPVFPFLERFLIAILPKPDHIFLLEDDPVAINERKDQLTPEEIRQYYTHMKHVLVQSNASFSVIDVGMGAQDASNQLFAEVKRIYG